MATFTPNYGFKKPSPTDYFNVEDFNNNFQHIDEIMKAGNLAGAVLSVNGKTGEDIVLTPDDIGAADKEHTHTAEELSLIPGDVGAAPAEHTHTLESLGAASTIHTHTPASIGAADSNHTHTPASIGAAAAAHSHTPASIGAAKSSHTHTPQEVGAISEEKVVITVDAELGDDSNDGTHQKPIKSLDKALEIAKRHRYSTIYLNPGIYQLSSKSTYYGPINCNIFTQSNSSTKSIISGNIIFSNSNLNFYDIEFTGSIDFHCGKYIISECDFTTNGSYAINYSESFSSISNCNFILSSTAYPISASNSVLLNYNNISTASNKFINDIYSLIYPNGNAVRSNVIELTSENLLTKFSNLFK